MKKSPKKFHNDDYDLDEKSKAKERQKNNKFARENKRNYE